MSTEVDIEAIARRAAREEIAEREEQWRKAVESIKDEIRIGFASIRSELQSGAHRIEMGEVAASNISARVAKSEDALDSVDERVDRIEREALPKRVGQLETDLRRAVWIVITVVMAAVIGLVVRNATNSPKGAPDVPATTVAP